MFSGVKKRVIIQKNSLNIFPLNKEKPRILVKFVFFQKFLKAYTISQDEQLFRIAAYLRKNGLNLLDYHLKTLIQTGWSYIENSGDFITKARNLGSSPRCYFTGGSGFVPQQPTWDRINSSYGSRWYYRRTYYFYEWTFNDGRFCFENKFFEFNRQIKQQSPGAAIGTQFAPPCVRLLIEKIVFLKTQELQHLVWFRYIEKSFLYLDT